MRPNDPPLPAVTLDAAPNLTRRPVYPVVAVAKIGGTAFADMSCFLTGLSLDVGPPNDRFVWPAAQLTVTAMNVDGTFSPWDPAGLGSGYGPGSRVVVWAQPTDGTAPEWLFAGDVTAWDLADDGTVTVTAFDRFAQWTAPTAGVSVGRYPGQRSRDRIIDLFGDAGRYADLAGADLYFGGLPLLLAPPSNRSLLVESEIVTASDGGVFYVNVAGQPTSRSRWWRAGDTAPGDVVTVTGNACHPGRLNVWDVSSTSNDGGVVDAVELANITGLVGRAGPTAPSNVYGDTGLIWTEQADGDRLAGDMLAQLARPPRFTVDGFAVHLYDPGQGSALWRPAIRWRLMDRIRVMQRVRVAGDVVVELTGDAVVIGTHDEFTVDGGWLRRVDLAGAYGPVDYLTGVNWDDPTDIWDDPDPTNIWTY